MECRLLLFCLFPFMLHQGNDLSEFLNAINGKIIYVRSFKDVLVRVKSEQVSECPGVIVAIFSVKGKRLSLNTCSSDEVTRYQLSPEQKMCTVCFLVNHKIFVYKGETDGTTKR